MPSTTRRRHAHVPCGLGTRYSRSILLLLFVFISSQRFEPRARCRWSYSSSSSWHGVVVLIVAETAIATGPSRVEVFKGSVHVDGSGRVVRCSVALRESIQAVLLNQLHVALGEEEWMMRRGEILRVTSQRIRDRIPRDEAGRCVSNGRPPPLGLSLDKWSESNGEVKLKHGAVTDGYVCQRRLRFATLKRAACLTHVPSTSLHLSSSLPSSAVRGLSSWVHAQNATVSKAALLRSLPW